MPDPGVCLHARGEENKACQGLKWPPSTESAEVIYTRLAGARMGKTP